MRLQILNDEVLYALDGVARVSAADIETLKIRAAGNQRKRARLCSHPDESNSLHEMLIVLGKDNYIRPHRHPGKSESFHVIEGRADVVMFDVNGEPLQRIELGDYYSGHCFYFRMDKYLFHSLVVRSDFFVFVETTNGPFIRTGMKFADWAPEEYDIEKGHQFLENKIMEMESV